MGVLDYSARDVAETSIISIVIAQELNFPNLIGKIQSTIGYKGLSGGRQQAFFVVAGIIASQELGFPNLLQEVTDIPRRFGIPIPDLPSFPSWPF